MLLNFKWPDLPNLKQSGYLIKWQFEHSCHWPFIVRVAVGSIYLVCLVVLVAELAEFAYNMHVRYI